MKISHPHLFEGVDVSPYRSTSSHICELYNTVHNVHSDIVRIFICWRTRSYIEYCIELYIIYIYTVNQRGFNFVATLYIVIVLFRRLNSSTPSIFQLHLYLTSWYTSILLRLHVNSLLTNIRIGISIVGRFRHLLFYLIIKSNETRKKIFKILSIETFHHALST